MQAPDDKKYDATAVAAERVARRALVLSAITCRGSIDSGAGRDDAELLLERIHAWTTAMSLAEEMEAYEQGLLQRSLGELVEKEIVESTWIVEGLAILSWALRWHELPVHDVPVNPYEVTDSALFLSDEAADAVTSARLRPVAELDAYRNLIYAIHSRLRDYVRHRSRKDFRAWVDKAWIDILGINWSSLVADNDLCINGSEICDASDENIQAAELMSYQRHKAIIWVLEVGGAYSQTQVDT